MNRSYMAAFALALVTACSAEGDLTELDGSATDATLAEQAERGLPIVEMEPITSLEGDFGQVDFFARPGFGDDEPSVIVEAMAKLGQGDRNIVSALTRDGATPLEIFRALSPETPAPEALVQNHAELAALQGRELEPRDYSSLPLAANLPIDAGFDGVNHCWLDLLGQYEVDTTPATVVNEEETSFTATNANVLHTFTVAQKFVGMYACAISSTSPIACTGLGGQNVTMVICSGPGGCGTFTGYVPPCLLGYVESTNRPKNSTYHVYAERNPRGPSTIAVTAITSAL